MYLLVQLNGVAFECEDVVGKDDDFVATSFMKTNQELAGPELVRIRYIQ